MISILYKHSDSNYITLSDNEIKKISKIDKLDINKIWVTNIPNSDIHKKNIKNIAFFGTSFGEIINNFGYNNLGTIEKLKIILKTINKIVKKVEKEHKIHLTKKKIESMENNLIDFHILKINTLKTFINKNFIFKSDNSIEFTTPQSKNFNIAYTARYPTLSRLSGISIPDKPIKENIKAKNEETFKIHICNVQLKNNIKDLKKAIIFKDLIGSNVILFDDDLIAISDIYNVDVVNTIEYTKSKLTTGVESITPDDSFSEEIYSNMMIDKIKSKNNIISLYIKSIERLYIYNDFIQIEKNEGLRVISILNNKFIIERDFNIDINLKKIKSIINLNISLIIKT